MPESIAKPLQLHLRREGKIVRQRYIMCSPDIEVAEAALRKVFNIDANHTLEFFISIADKRGQYREYELDPSAWEYSLSNAEFIIMDVKEGSETNASVITHDSTPIAPRFKSKRLDTIEAIPPFVMQTDTESTQDEDADEYTGSKLSIKPVSAKRPPHSSSSGNKLKLRIQHPGLRSNGIKQENEEDPGFTEFMVKPTHKLKKMLATYEKQQEYNNPEHPIELVYYYNDQPLNGEDTVESAGVIDGAMILAVLVDFD